MESMPIKNVVFDVGNVLVKWSPTEIITRTFADVSDIASLTSAIFTHDIWYALNRGELTEEEAKQEYHRHLQIPESDLDRLFYHIKDTLDLVDGSVELLERVYQAGYPLYALTDNVKELVHYLRKRYDFWTYFQGAIVSAEVKCLKPEPAIYQHLLNDYELVASETVFIDDSLPNIHGAQALGLQTVHFHDAEQCANALKELGVQF